jgi:transcriptional regulator with XRE-family HTH domain
MPPSRTCTANGDFHFVDVHVGARLRRRERLGIKVQQLAALIGVSFQQIQKYESAENRISPSRLYSFARALAIPVGLFFDGLPRKAQRQDRGRALICLFGCNLRLKQFFFFQETAVRIQGYSSIMKQHYARSAINCEICLGTRHLHTALR